MHSANVSYVCQWSLYLCCVIDLGLNTSSQGSSMPIVAECRPCCDMGQCGTRWSVKASGGANRCKKKNKGEECRRSNQQMSRQRYVKLVVERIFDFRSAFFDRDEDLSAMLRNCVQRMNTQVRRMNLNLFQQNATVQRMNTQVKGVAVA